jgi:hypothetical protein
MEILKDAIKLPGRNAHIFLIVAISTMIPYSLLALANAYSVTSLISDLSISIMSFLSNMDPASELYHKLLYKIQADSILLILEQIIFLVVMTVILLSSTVSTVYVSAMSYLGKDLTLKDLWLKLKKIWVRPLITWFYISLMITSFFFFLVSLSTIVVLGRGSIVIAAIGLVLIVLVTCLNMYFVLIWMLSLVTSVLEDCYGLEALAKAENLVKGRKVVGFVLTFVLSVLFSAVYLISFASKDPSRTVRQIFVTFFVMNLIMLVKILSMMVCTVFYIERKQSHGEALELAEEMGYNSVSTIPLDSSALP